MNNTREPPGQPQWTVSSSIQQILQQALSFHHQGNLDKAKTLYEEILQKEPFHFDALQLLAAVFVPTDQPAFAEALYQIVLKIDPNKAAVHSNRGNTLWALMRSDEALASYDEVIKINPDDAVVFYNRGIVLQALQRFDDALDSYDKAISIKSDYAEAHSNRGTARSR